MALKSALKISSDAASKYYVARAVDKYVPHGKDELEFKKGDLILVVEENGLESKLRGEVIRSGKVKGDKLGWFPMYFVRKDEKEKLPDLPPSLLPKKDAEKPKKGVNLAGDEPAGTRLSPAPAVVSATNRSAATSAPVPVSTSTPDTSNGSSSHSHSNSSGGNSTPSIVVVSASLPVTLHDSGAPRGRRLSVAGGVAIPPSSSGSSSVSSGEGSEGSEQKASIALKRSKLQKLQSIRTLQLLNEEDDDDDDDEPDDEPLSSESVAVSTSSSQSLAVPTTVVQPPCSPRSKPQQLSQQQQQQQPQNKNVYMQNVASNMVSKMVFMQQKKPRNQKRVGATPASSPGKDKRGFFASLRPGPSASSSSSSSSSAPKKPDADDPPGRYRTSTDGTKKKPLSAPGSVARPPVSRPAEDRVTAQSIQQRLSQSGVAAPDDAAAAAAPRPPTSLSSSVDSRSSLAPQSAPVSSALLAGSPVAVRRATGSSGELEMGSPPRHGSQSASELPISTATVLRTTAAPLRKDSSGSVTPDSPESSSMGRRAGKVAVRAVIVDDELPVPQRASVDLFNPEGKNIEIICELGKGATSVVWKGAIDGEFVALKQISLLGVKNPKALRMALRDEVDLLKPLNHANILKYYAMFYSRVNQEINIVLELVDGVACTRLIARNGTTEPLAALMTAQVLEALLFLNRCGIIHRDIKPQNLLLNLQGVLKLIDFGTVARLSGGVAHRNSTVGTPWYVAPEVINGENYSYPADIWSVACTLLEMVTGKPPYADQNSVAALFKMVEEPHPPLPASLSELCRTFVLECFARDPAQRPMPTAALQRPFVVQKKAPIAELAAAVRAIHAATAVTKEDFALST